MTPREIGKLGEKLAARYLRRRLWAIPAKNFRHGRCEIDLVGFRFGILVFFEVKTRTGDAFGAPADAVDAKKIRNLRYAGSALRFINQKNGCLPIKRLGITRYKHVRKDRIDVIEVFLTREGKLLRINHKKDLGHGTEL